MVEIRLNKDERTEKIRSTIKTLKDIAENLIGCQKGERGTEEFFDCNGCDKLGQCFNSVSESVAGIAIWVSAYIEEQCFGETSDTITDQVKKFIGVETDKEEKEEKINQEGSMFYS